MSTNRTPQADYGADMSTKRLAVIGGGRMGHAIAQIFAARGWSVSVVEPDDAVRLAVPERLRQICLLRGHNPAIADHIDLHSGIEDAVTDVDLVIEAIPEVPELKQDLFARLEAMCSRWTILATNTSVIPVSVVGQRLVHGDRLIGTHFWNPPYAVRLVEVVQSTRTSAAVVDRVMGWMGAVGQRPVHVRKDTPGFIGNRLQHALKREAIAVVEEGICDAETVDYVVRNSFGARLGIIGPLEQSDLVGVNLTLEIHRILLPHLDTSTGPQNLLVDLIKKGHLGAATGQGFRRWSDAEREELQHRLDNALRAAARDDGPTDTD